MSRTEKLRRWVGRSFRNRIFVTVLAAALLPLLACGGLLLRLQMVRAEESLAQEAAGQLADLEDALHGFWTDCRQICQTLAESTVVHSALRRGGGDSRTLYQVLYRRTESLRPYARFDVYDSEGVCRYTTASTPPAGALDPGWGVLRAAGETDGLALLAGEDGGLTAAQAVRSRSGAVLGYIAAQVDQSGFDRLFNGLYSAVGDMILLDGRWRTVYCSQPAQGRTTVACLRQQLLEGRPLTGSSGEYAFFTARHPETGLFLILQRPRPFTTLVLHSVYLVGALVGAAGLLVCMWCAWILSRYLSRPVHQLDEAMGEVEKGQLDVQLETDRDDELGRLASQFNRMAAEYRLNLERSVQRERELNEARLGMLQAQLNPHFLYNTLDAMKWLGVVHQAPQVATLATNLADILRFSISGEELVTLERELELIGRYIDIQLIRFEDRFTCEIDVADRFQSCLVPKLALQPLVENAIIHGLADRDDGYIKVRALQEGADLVLAVSDNGCGMPPEVLERLNSGDKRIPGGHLGLYNTDSIIRLRFGEGYGLTARSVPGEGSCVELRLPIQREEAGDAEGAGC